MRIDVPWGAGRVSVEIEGDRVAGVLGANGDRSVDPAEVLQAALETPGTEFEAFLATAMSPLLVVVNDGTRPTPSAEGLEGWLQRPGRELSFVVATGTHRAASYQEVEKIFGVDLAKAHAGRIFSHDAKDKDDLVHLGRTSRGTEVWVNRLLTESRSVVVINSVEPHYFAGYTGGRKSLIPGLAGYETVWANHRLSTQEGSEHLRLDGNPVHEDLEESLALGVVGKEVYSVQMVLDKDHHVGFASAGSLEKSFNEARTAADKQFVLELKRRCEVVVAVAPHPMDCNFYQTYKAIQSGALAVEDGGVLIVVSECPDGLGENQTLYEMLAAAESPADALARSDHQEYRLGAHQVARVAAILERADVWVASSLEDKVVRSMFMTPLSSVQEALDAAMAREDGAAEVLFLTEASITVPRVKESG